MNAQLHLLVGLAAIHLAWALAYVTGGVLDGRAPRPRNRSEALVDFVVRSATGLALWGFGAFLLGLVGGLTPAGLAALFAAFALALRLVQGPRLFSRAAWRERADDVGLAFGPGTLLIFYVGLATAVPAVFPDISSDGVRYHLAYAADWANHGNLWADRFLRQPYYANNFLLLFTEFDLLGLPGYAQFLVWLCGTLAMLGVRAAITLVNDAVPPSPSRFARTSRRAVTMLLPVTVVVSPVFLTWDFSGLVDIPMELFAFLPALCAVAAFTAKRDLRWSAVCCGAFFIGMKVTLLAFAPLFAVTLWVLIGALGGSRRARALACLVLLLAGSPWYVRNVIYDHDPVPPVFNLALHRPDLTYTAEDARRTLDDLKSDRSAGALLTLPYRAWADPQSKQLREYGTVALTILLYVPVLVLGLAFASGVRSNRGKALIVLCATCAYAVAYCILTSYLLRYLLVTQAVLAAAVGSILVMLPAMRAASAARIAVAAASLVPSPNTFDFYNRFVQINYVYLEPRLASDSTYLGINVRGYPQTELVLASPLFARRPAPRVLLLRVETEYYFRIKHVETVGDWFGPGRYSDLQVALDNDRLPDYIRKFDIGAVILYRHARVIDAVQFPALVKGLTALGFRIAENDADFFVAIRDRDVVPTTR